MLGLAVLAVCAAPLAGAQGTGWYGGASVGRSAATIDDDRITGGLAVQGLATTALDDDDRDTGYKVFGGYQFTPNLGVEAGYFDLGNFGYRASTAPGGSLSGDIRLKGLNLDLVGTLPLAGRLSALGRLGVVSVRASDNFSATGAVRMPYASASPSKRSAGVKAGLGLMYDVTDSLAVRAEVERYRIKDAVGNRGDVDLLSVGLIYRFGASPQPVRAAAPQPVALAAAPPPVVAARGGGRAGTSGRCHAAAASGVTAPAAAPAARRADARHVLGGVSVRFRQRDGEADGPTGAGQTGRGPARHPVRQHPGDRPYRPARAA